MIIQLVSLLIVAFFNLNLCTIVDIPLKAIDEATYERWSTFTLPEKLPYLLDTTTKDSFSSEFLKWLELETSIEDLKGFTFHTMMTHLSDFRSENEVAQYFTDCDTDNDGVVDHLEFILCRGEYNPYAEPMGLNEYDVLESVLIYDYEQKRNDPNYQIPGYKYDEDGIIIDEL